MNSLPIGSYIVTNTGVKPRKGQNLNDKRILRRRNKTYKGSLTKYRKNKQNKETLIFVLLAVIILSWTSAITNINKLAVNSFTISVDTSVGVNKIDTSTGVIAGRNVTGEEQKTSPSLSVIREITRYNAGDPLQTDNTPCLGAMGTNICEKLAQGKKICAANFVKLGTIINIEGYGDCVVEDRMNARFPERVDIAMQAHEKPEAIKAGLKHLQVIIK
jgi:3D (Asp-Asp-Asp) domain-containing protein